MILWKILHTMFSFNYSEQDCPSTSPTWSHTKKKLESQWRQCLWHNCHRTQGGSQPEIVATQEAEPQEPEVLAFWNQSNGPAYMPQFLNKKQNLQCNKGKFNCHPANTNKVTNSGGLNCFQNGVTWIYCKILGLCQQECCQRIKQPLPGLKQMSFLAKHNVTNDSSPTDAISNTNVTNDGLSLVF